MKRKAKIPGEGASQAPASSGCLDFRVGKALEIILEAALAPRLLQLLSPAQRLRLTELPDPMDERELARHYTLSEEDLAAIGKRRRPETRTGFAVQLCYLRFPGRSLASN